MQNDHSEILVTIDNKIDEVKDKLHSIEIVQTRMESDLKYHIKRTDLLEDRIGKMDDDIKPIESLKGFFMTITKIVTFLMAITFTVNTVIKLIFNK